MTGENSFQVGEWLVEPDLDRITRTAASKTLRPKVMELLQYLSRQEGRVVSADELMNELWADRIVASGSVYNCVSELREALEDDDGQYVETIPKKGYRLTAVVSRNSATGAIPPSKRPNFARYLAVAAIALVVFAFAFVEVGRESGTDLPADIVPNPKSIAVLPFVYVGEENARGEAIAFAIQDDLLTLLSRLDDLQLIARTTVAGFSDPDINPGVIGKQIPVRNVVRGSVQSSGNLLRVNVHLIDVVSGEYLWSQQYERVLTAPGIFAMQTDIAISIVGHMHASLSQDEKLRLAAIPTENYAAYEAFELGKRRAYERTVSALEESISYFRQAIELDREFALAYAGLADALIKYVDYADRIHDADLIGQAQTAAETAVDLGPELGEAHIALATVNTLMRNRDAANEEFLRGISLSPNMSTAYHYYGLFLAQIGRFDESLEQLQRALTLDPLSSPVNMATGIALTALGRYDEAIQKNEKALEIDSRFVIAYSQLCHIRQTGTGQLDLGIRECAKVLELDPRSTFAAVRLADMYNDLGDREMALQWARKVTELSPDRQWREFMVSDDRASLLQQAARILNDPSEKITYEWQLADYLVDTGRYTDARALVERTNPQWFSGDIPELGWFNDRDAARAAIILDNTGDPERADELFGRILAYLSGAQRNGPYGFHFLDVMIHGYRGETAEANAAFRNAFEANLRFGFWRIRTNVGPWFDELQGDTEFQEIVANFESDLAQQLQNVRKMMAEGEVRAVPP